MVDDTDPDAAARAAQAAEAAAAQAAAAERQRIEAEARARESSQTTTPSRSNVQPGVDLETGVRDVDDADTLKRDAKVEELASQYEEPEQRDRVYARFADKENA